MRARPIAVSTRDTSTSAFASGQLNDAGNVKGLTRSKPVRHAISLPHCKQHEQCQSYIMELSTDANNLAQPRHNAFSKLFINITSSPLSAFCAIVS